MFIFEYPDNSIREKTISLIANSILDTGKESGIENLLSHPDFIYLAFSEKTKTNKISIEDVHKFKERLWSKSVGEIKVAVINNAHNLTVDSQNALLKDLEEEPENTIIILAASDRRLLLSTILSRGISVNFSDISIIHPSLKQEKIKEIVYNINEEKVFGWDILRFVKMNLYDRLMFISQEIEGKEKEKSAEGSKKADLVESFLSDLLSYYEQELLGGKDTSKELMLIEDGIGKIKKGVTPKAVLEYITLSINNG